MKILFISANRVGDAVLTTGLLKHLVDKHPDAQFTIACGPYGADLFRGTPQLQKLIVMKKKKWNGHWVNLWSQCIGTKWDLIVDMRNSLVSRLLFAKKRAMHRRSSGKHKVVDNGTVLGLTPPPDPYIYVMDEARREAARLLPAGQPVLALGPAANWALKQWPVEHFIGLVAALTAPDAALQNATVLILADKHEREQITPLLRAIPDAQRVEIIGRDLQTAAACLQRARLYVGNDSGLMHLSAALGTPTLGLFGPGFPHIYGPWGKKCAFVSTSMSRDELLALPPDVSNPSLLKTLGIDKAVAAANELIERTI